MGYDNENSDALSPIVLDIETAGLPNAADFLDPVTAARNLKDPEKIKADIEQRTAERDGKLALDWNVGRIVALGWWSAQHGISTHVCGNDDYERDALLSFWSIAKQRTIVGFNIKGFDLKFMIQRSRYLGVPYPDLDLGKYTRRGIVDLFSELTFNDGTYDQGAMRRTLQAFCRRFGIPVEDQTTGKDIAALVAKNDWVGVTAHLRSDIILTVSLARRLGAIQAQPDAVAV